MIEKIQILDDYENPIEMKKKILAIFFFLEYFKQ